MIFEKNAKILFTGDSITDVGRMRPVGYPHIGLGSGYPNLVNTLLQAYYPEMKYCVLNMGISGNTSRDLVGYWETDILSKNADYISILIGVNDNWRKVDNNTRPDICVEVDEYEANLRKIIEMTIGKVKKLFLISPFFFETNKADLMASMVSSYGGVCKKLASEYGLEFIDMQAIFDKYMKTVYGMTIAGDRVHPNMPAHFLIATAFLKAAGFDFSKLEEALSLS